MNVIEIESGTLTGTVLREPGKEVYVYPGIPHAAPPLGDLRWKPLFWKEKRMLLVKNGNVASIRGRSEGHI